MSSHLKNLGYLLSTVCSELKVRSGLVVANKKQNSGYCRGMWAVLWRGPVQRGKTRRKEKLAEETWVMWQYQSIRQ